MPVYNPTNPVAVGLATKVDHYDRLWENVESIYDSLRTTNELWIPASAFRPHASAGCGPLEDLLLSANRYVQGMPFDPTSIENASLTIALPKRWNNGTVTFQAYWLNTAGGSGGVVWYIAGVAAGDNESLDAALGLQSSVDSALAAKNIAISPESSPITFTGTPATGDLIRLVVQRDPTSGSDTYASDAYLLGIKLRVTVSEPNDA